VELNIQSNNISHIRTANGILYLLYSPDKCYNITVSILGPKFL